MKKAILLSIVLAGTLFSVKPQSYPKAPGAIRLLTYNTHYCKGGYDPGEINESNVKKLAQVIKALDADVIALQMILVPCLRFSLLRSECVAMNTNFSRSS